MRTSSPLALLSFSLITFSVLCSVYVCVTASVELRVCEGGGGGRTGGLQIPPFLSHMWLNQFSVFHCIQRFESSNLFI